MNKDQIHSLVDTYRHILRDAGAQSQIVDINQSLTRDQMLGHCLWVLDERLEDVLRRIGGFQEAIRLIGFTQGILMACGLCTIAETRKHANEAKFVTWEQFLA